MGIRRLGMGMRRRPRVGGGVESGMVQGHTWGHRPWCPVSAFGLPPKQKRHHGPAPRVQEPGTSSFGDTVKIQTWIRVRVRARVRVRVEVRSAA